MGENAKTTLRKRYHHGDLRAALIEATLSIISETRVEDFSVADAARAAGVSSAAPYRHFRDREDLLAHAAAEGFRRLEQATREAREAHPDGSVEGLIAGGCAYVEFGAANPELFHLMWGAARPHGETDIARKTGEACYDEFIVTLSGVMQKNGLGGQEPNAFGAPLWAMVHGFASLLIGKNEKLDQNRESIRRYVAEATWAYFTGMGAPVRRPPPA